MLNRCLDWAYLLLAVTAVWRVSAQEDLDLAATALWLLGLGQLQTGELLCWPECLRRSVRTERGRTPCCARSPMQSRVPRTLDSGSLYIAKHSYK